MGYNEYIDIYYGNNATGIPLYSEKLGSTDSYKVYEPEDYCFPYGDYYAVLGLNYMGIWDINSKLTIKQNGVIVAVLQWNCESSKDCGLYFSIELPLSWQYSSTPCFDDSWRVKTLDWPSYSEDFPAPNTTTRYFRRSVLLNKNKNFGMYVQVTTDAGAVVYVNGQELVRWNMPLGEVTPFTQGIPSDVVTHKYAQLFAALPAPENDAYIFAIELHAGPNLPGIEHFNCSVMYLYSDFRLIDSDGSSECTDDNVEDPSWRCSNIFDDDFKTEWSVLWNDYSFPTSHTWRFGNNDRMIVNKYYVGSTNNEQLLTCYSWTISASNDGLVWEVLDYQQ